MQHPAEYEASLRAERERYAMHGQSTEDVDAELKRIGAGVKTRPPMEDAADSTPLEKAAPRRGRPRKES